MKKILASVFALAVLAGCASYYDYYEGGVRYTQDGEDCIYYAGEFGRNFSADIRGMNNGKKIVYRNTRCADLYNRDMIGQAPRHDRQILAPAAREVAAPCDSCNVCKSCGVQPVSRKYYVVSAM